MPGSHATSICNLARLDDAVVAEYAERIAAAGDQFPPLIVFSDGHGFLLVDGYLRVEAAQLLQLATLPCEVRQGDLRAAILLSASVNATHGHRRTNADKRLAVGKRSNAEIALRCRVSDGLVGRPGRAAPCCHPSLQIFGVRKEPRARNRGSTSPNMVQSPR